MKFTLFFILSFMFVPYFTANIYSQEIGIAPTKIFTDNKEIDSPIGFSFFVFQPIWKIGLKLEYVYAEHERNYYGLLNGGFLIAPNDFIHDSIQSNASYRAVEISLQIPALFNILKNQVNVGGGITFDKFRREKTGLTTGKIFHNDDSKLGIFFAISLSRSKILGIPLKIEILYKSKFLINENYATDTENPFADVHEIKVLQLIFSYVF